MNQLPLQIQQLDDRILEWAQQAIGVSPILDGLFRVVGEWLVYLVPFGLIVLWLWIRYGTHIKDWQSRRKKLISLTAAGLLAWQVLSGIVKHFYFRERPSVAGKNVKELFFHRPDESFPSDHSALFFAFAVYAYLLGWKKAGHWLLVVAVAVSIARIVTGTHWFTDILGGALIGILGAYLVWWLRTSFEKWFAKPVQNFLVKIGL